MCVTSIFVCHHQKTFFCTLPYKLCVPKLLLAYTRCEKCSLNWPLARGRQPFEQTSLPNNQFHMYESLNL